MEWKKLENTDLEVSENGDVKNHVKNTTLKPQKDRFGYLSAGVSYKNPKKYKKTAIHRLVGMLFLENPENKPFINHKDGNKANNHYSNLEWVTSRENLDHYKNVLMPQRKIKKAYEIIDLIREGYSHASISRIIGVSQKTIWSILNWYWFERNPKIKKTKGIDF